MFPTPFLGSHVEEQYSILSLRMNLSFRVDDMSLRVFFFKSRTQSPITLRYDVPNRACFIPDLSLDQMYTKVL